VSRSVRASAALELQRQVFATAETLDPGEADELVTAIVSHLRAWRPEAVAPLGVLPPPGEPIRDPRD
jgi:hypothetical protein